VHSLPSKTEVHHQELFSSFHELNQLFAALSLQDKPVDAVCFILSGTVQVRCSTPTMITLVRTHLLHALYYFFLSDSIRDRKHSGFSDRSDLRPFGGGSFRPPRHVIPVSLKIVYPAIPVLDSGQSRAFLLALLTSLLSGIQRALLFDSF